MLKTIRVDLTTSCQHFSLELPSGKEKVPLKQPCFVEKKYCEHHKQNSLLLHSNWLGTDDTRADISKLQLLHGWIPHEAQ